MQLCEYFGLTLSSIFSSLFSWPISILFCLVDVYGHAVVFIPRVADRPAAGVSTGIGLHWGLTESALRVG